ncbi:UNVERIFIED_ORG: quercetin dioxygenase-like cupin family protein [Rhizobium esperanzae]
MKVISIATALFALACPANAFENNAVAATLILRTDRTIAGQPIIVPRKDVEVIASIYEIAPGATLPIHQHRYQRYGYVLSGEITVTNTESGKESIFTAGNFIVESWGIWHKGANNGTEPVKLLVIDQVEKGSENVLPQK